MNTFILCLTQAVLCSSGSLDCTDIVKHGQMLGVVLAQHSGYYTANFAEAAEEKNFEGDFRDIDVPRTKCQEYKP